jgi:hypothetical protein
MATTLVRWTLRLPWSAQDSLHTLVRLDAPGRPGDICGRAISHLLDHDDHLVAALSRHAARQRHDRPSERTVLCSLRLDAAIRERLQTWLLIHPDIALSWVVEAAIRGWLHVCQHRTDQPVTTAGLAPRRYRRLARDLVVITDADGVEHAA